MDDVRGIHQTEHGYYLCSYCAKDVPGTKDVSASATGSAVEMGSPEVCEDCGDLLGDIDMTDEGYYHIARTVYQFLDSGYGNAEYARQIWETYPQADEYLQEMMSNRWFGHIVRLAIERKMQEVE